MKLPLLFRRERTLAKVDAQDQAERLLAESLRMLGQVCTKVADLVEAQRLERRGYSEQLHSLRRLDEPSDSGPKKE